MAFDALENAVLHRTANTVILTVIFLQLTLPETTPLVESLYGVMFSGAVLFAGYVVIKSIVNYVRTDEITTPAA